MRCIEKKINHQVSANKTMTDQEKELINDLISGKLTRENFPDYYPIDLSAGTNYILEELEEAADNKMLTILTIL
jgi:hypothetical protein